jgi:hypothetical protein
MNRRYVAIELGYASAAVLGALLDRLITVNLLSPDDAKVILDDAVVSLQSVGSFSNIAVQNGAIELVGEVRAQLKKHGVA